MCGKVNQTESVTTMLGVLSCLYEDHAEDASLLLDLYARECDTRGAEEGCVMASMLSASVYVTMNLLGDQGKERVNMMNMWWAAQCPG
jgi:hypothetical protein